MPLSFDNLRIGKQYYLKNYGEVSEFRVEERLANGNFKLTDLHTLEHYYLFDLIRYGRSDDFDLVKIGK